MQAWLGTKFPAPRCAVERQGNSLTWLPSTAHTTSGNPLAGTSHTGAIVLFGFLGSALLATASLVLADGDGWRAAAEMVSRLSLILFVAAMIVEPLGRLVPVRALGAIGRERGSFTLAFAAASAAALVCVAAPPNWAAKACRRRRWPIAC